MISLVQRKSSGQSCSGTPSISAITAIVIGADTSCTKSISSRCAAASITSRVICRTFGSQPCTARGVKRLLATWRYFA